MTEMETSRHKSSDEKVLSIELLRFACAFSVLVWHYAHFTFGSSGQVQRCEYPFYWIFNLFYEKGYFAVQMFWMISGYIFFWKYGSAIAKNEISFKKFAIWRFSRLYPLHFVTLTLVAIMQFIFFKQNVVFFVYADNSIKDFVLQLFMANFWLPEPVHSFNAPIWSVSVEIIAYIVFFSSLRFFGKCFYKLFLVFIILLFPLLSNLFVNLFWCLLFFYAGGFVHFFNEFASSHKNKGNLLFYVVMTTVISAIYLNQVHSQRNFRVMVIGFAALAIITECLKIPKKYESCVAFLGNLTYSSYLLHFPLQLLIAVICVALDCEIPYRSNIFFVSFVLLTFALSAVWYSKFEVPVRDFIRNKCRKFV